MIVRSRRSSLADQKQILPQSRRGRGEEPGTGTAKHGYRGSDKSKPDCRDAGKIGYRERGMSKDSQRSDRAAPERIHYSGAMGHIALLPDGRLLSHYTIGRPKGEVSLPGPAQPAYLRYSSDHGRTWSDPEIAYTYAPGRGRLPSITQSQGTFVLVDRRENIHAFALRYNAHHPPKRWDPSAPAATDLLHNTSRDGGKTWTEPRRVDYGHPYTGEIMSVIQLQGGRILVPLGYNTENYIRERGEYERRIVTVYSDDCGETWEIGSDDTSTPIGLLMGHTGAMEPVAIEVKDDRVWMIIRTQTPRFYESFSADGGRTWTHPSPTQFQAPNAPAAVARLADGRLVLSWNDLSEYPEEPIRSARQYLHIAISGDDGRSWSRSKLIAQREEGEHENINLRYPFLCETADGHILVRYHRTGGRDGVNRRELLRIDPDWIADR